MTLPIEELRIQGLLNVHKPPGMSSRDVVNILNGSIRQHLRSLIDPDDPPRDAAAVTATAPPRRNVRVVTNAMMPKVGHAGTLDPLAQGVLVIGVGGASRLVSYVQQTAKRYRGTFRLGCTSESGDLEKPLSTVAGDPVPDRDAIAAAAAALKGTILQTPPIYSAVSVGGRRAYQMAREGLPVDVPPRPVEIGGVTLIRYDYPEMELDIVCGSGTYVRSLGIDLAAGLGANAVMTALVRTAVGPYAIEDSVTIDAIRQGHWTTRLMPARTGLVHLDCVHADEAVVQKIGFGQSLMAQDLDIRDGDKRWVLGKSIDADLSDLAVWDHGGRLCAMLYRSGSRWRPKRVFHDRL